MAKLLRTLKKRENEFFSNGTIYNRMSVLSNYYEFLRPDGKLARIIPINPTQVSLPRVSKPFESESIKALRYKVLLALLNVVGNYSLTNEPRYLRDFAILQMFVVTGRQRKEIIFLTGENIIVTDDRFFIRNKVKGGNFLTFEMDDPIAQDALFNYLEATNRRMEIFGKKVPLWLRHMKGSRNLQKAAITSHGFSKNIKRYALEAGLKGFRIHQLRHTFAKIVSEKTESIVETQETLGHSNIKTTQVYVKRLSVKKDKFSWSIREVMNQEKSKDELIHHSKIVQPGFWSIVEEYSLSLTRFSGFS